MSERGAQSLELNAPRTLPASYGPSRPAFSVVVPCFNEAEGVGEFHKRLRTVMDSLAAPWEVVYVNDGSRDETLEALRRLKSADPRVGIVNLSRNFGKEIALTAGLDHAGGDQVIVIDADLQDPPEVILDLVAKSKEGFDVVYAQRRTRSGETWLKKTTASAFYRISSRLSRNFTIPANTGDFRVMSRRATDALLKLRETHRYMKGLFAWIGFPSAAVLYDRDPRFAGETSFNYWKLWNLAIEGVTSFTALPLKLSTYLGLLSALAAIIYALFIVARTVLFGNPVAGYPSLIVVILFMGGTQLMVLGIIGEYLGRVFNETKGRPLYLATEFEPPAAIRRESRAS